MKDELISIKIIVVLVIMLKMVLFIYLEYFRVDG